jgi:ribosome-associated protein
MLMENQIKNLNIIAQAIYDKKGFNILALDVKGISSLTDYLIIAEGSVDKHLQAIANNVIHEMDENPVHVEGKIDGTWIVIDYVDIVIHLFTPTMRERYKLERLWEEGKIVDLDIKTKIDNLEDLYG